MARQEDTKGGGGEGEEDSILRKSARYITKEEGDGNSQSHGERKNLDKERRKAR